MKLFPKLYLHVIVVGAIIVHQFMPVLVLASGLKDDETVLFFKIDAYQKISHETDKVDSSSKTQFTHSAKNSVKSSNNNMTWMLPLHAWVYEQEEDSLWRSKLTQQIANEIEVKENSAQFHNLQNVLTMFLVDSQSLKTLALLIDDQLFSFGRSGLNGHIQETIEFSSRHNDTSLDVVINEPVLNNEKKLREAIIRLIPNEGISIVSDIDDTIKESHVLDKKELIKNTFLRPARAVTGMNLWYQNILQHFSDIQTSKAYFHYVSASPWQLYPMLESFLQQNGFPSGSLYLRKFRFKDRSLLSFLKPSTDYKVATITQLMKQYPGRDFILIGDSGEHDPEIYGRIQREFPDQVKMIYIRKVPGSDLSEQRFQQAFRHTSMQKWQLFEEQKLPGFIP